MRQQKLGRRSGPRRALLRQLVTQLLERDRIQTTEAKARAIRPIAEKMITLAKRGDLHARRVAAAYLTSEDVLKRLFDEIGPRYRERRGGYTRMLRLPPRRGDAAPMSIVELV